MVNVVWIPWGVTWNEPETEVEIVELAGNPDISANDPKANGPFRTTLYDAINFTILSQKWEYNGETWTASEDEEQEAIDAWEAWVPPLE